MLKSLYWNTRSINTALERLRQMIRSLKFPISQNLSIKIRVFWEDGLDCEVINSDEQQILIKMPWIVAGDFNCIVDPAEQMGGRPD
ncbi:hypothetical protein H5410_005401 [Solanum commersonii]|uniref:DUF4283 domain-containing protein n=1 Tax=Solanum commersonii TaxID=4109 RepID=A0A9J6A847_SOLCO|nr:hypothetical protein H5410_005401 [Solanum commersonii]